LVQTRNSPDRQQPGEEQADVAPTGADRVLATLRLLAEYRDGAGLSDLARRLNSPKSSVHRALAALRRAGFVDQNGRDRYHLSYDFVRLVFSYYEGIDDVVRLRPLLEDLANQFGETCHYAVLERPDIVYHAKVQAVGARFQMTSAVGGRNPAHRTGVGKALLAYELLDRGAVDAYAGRYGPLEPTTPNTICTAAGLTAELAEIRRLGYAVDREENELGITCLALPLFLTSAERPDGAISVTTVVHRTPLEQLVAAVDQMRDKVRLHVGEVLG
jgi:IclR family acetate operon transcriptional repressor